MQDLQSALDKADGKAPGPNHVEARFIKALPAPVQWLLVHSYRAILRGEAGSDPRGHLGVTWGVYLCAGKPPLADIHLGVTWGVYLCAGKPPLADIILSHPPDLTRCDSVIVLAIPAMSGHIQYRGAASGDLYIGISGINRVSLS